jgi:exopolyphosphatase/guanosine-5'-triphosphate,3'-diphosphate pyrophosphatase
MVTDDEWQEMKEALRENLRGQKNTIAIGTGGNINKVFSLSKKKDGKPLHIDVLRDYHKEFSSCTLEDRIRLYNLRPDRADVIVPALMIYLQVMKWGNMEEILVPKIGLADGLIQHLYAEATA